MGRRVRDGEPFGITVPDLAELFDLDYKTAWRNMERFCRDGWMKRTDLARHRPDMVPTLRRRATIYVTTDKHLPWEENRWRRFRIPQSAPRQTA